MKTSNYNFLVQSTENSDQFMLFNGLTKILGVFDREKRDIIAQILENPNNESIDETLRYRLARSQFIIPDEVDELKIIQHQYLNMVYNKTELALTILPTLQCNFKCIYCYQRHSRHIYQEEKLEENFTTTVKDRIYKLIENKLAAGVKHVRITWYGGEPTLAMDEIIEMTKRIGEMCQTEQAFFGVDIVTNGYLLHIEEVQALAPYLNGVIITVDGPAEIHDQRRKHLGESTYDIILNNMEKIQQFAPSVGIVLRVTIDRTNVEKIPLLLDDIENRGITGLSMRFRSLYTDSAKNTEFDQAILSSEETHHIVPQLIRESLKRGIMGSFEPSLSSFMRCNAPTLNAFVITPDGKLYKCWADAGISDCAIGELSEEGDADINYNAMEWITYNPLNKSQCLTCKMLPMCMGDCCYNDVVSTFKPDAIKRSNAGCSLFKYHLEEMLSLYLVLRETVYHDLDKFIWK